jgi:hypothetical protein
MGQGWSEMQCTSPINIVKNLQTEKICKLKCSYQFKYAPTTLSVWNVGCMIMWEVDEVAIPPVIYNDENYHVSLVLLVQPSIHTFNGKHADAELMIFHMNTRGTKKLMVCIPITQSSTSTSESSNFFDLIMGEISQTAPASGQHTIFNNATFSLSKFVPMKPYFAYTGANLLWNIPFQGKCYNIPKNFKSGEPVEPLASDIDYIVFHLDDAINMSPQALAMLKQFTPTADQINIPTIDESLNPGGIFFNPNGPVPQNSGEIYIDCKPTGDDGEILVTARQDSGGLLSNATLKRIWNYTFMKMIVGAIIMIILWKVSINIIDGIASNSARMSGGGGGKGIRGGGGKGMQSGGMQSGGMQSGGMQCGVMQCGT